MTSERDNPGTRQVSAEDRYSRLALAGWDRDVLRNARVLVAGAGALGNEAIKNLALAGIGSLLIVDFDTIEVTNLSRSVLFRESDVGRPKAEVAASRAAELNPDVDISWSSADIETGIGAGVFRRMTAVLGCLDNRAARLCLTRRCRLVGKPWIDGALQGSDGSVRLFAGREGPCYECTLTASDYADLRRRFSCQGGRQSAKENGNAVIPTTPTAASLVAAIQVDSAVRIMHGKQVPYGHELVYASATGELVKTRLPEKTDCLSHETGDPLVELADFSAGRTTSAELLAAAQSHLGPQALIEVDREIVTALVCSGCARAEKRSMALEQLRPEDLKCGHCGTERTVQSRHRIDADCLFLDMPLGNLGFPPGHIFRAKANGSYAYLELTGDFPATLNPNRLCQAMQEK